VTSAEEPPPARVHVDLVAAAAEASPLSELPMTTSDLSRVQPLLGELALALCNLLSTDLAVVWVTLPGEPVLVPSAWVGFPDDYIGPMRVPYGTGSAGRAVGERRTVLVEDIATSPHYGAWRDGALQQGVRTVLSVPMLTLNGEPMGSLTTYYREAFAPTSGTWSWRRSTRDRLRRSSSGRGCTPRRASSRRWSSAAGSSSRAWRGRPWSCRRRTAWTGC
jgi:GAF domain-containing protein